MNRNLVLILFACSLASSSLGQSAQPQTKSSAPSQSNSQLRQMEANAKFLQDRFAKARDEYEDQRHLIQHLQNTLDKEGISAVSYPKIMSHLEMERIRLTIELAGHEASLLSMTKLVEESHKQKSDDQALRDQAEQQLEELLQTQTKIFQSVEQLYKTGEGSLVETLTARKALLEAEMRLMQFRMQPNPVSQTSQTNKSSTLIEASVEKARLRAQLSLIEKLLADLRKQRSLVQEIQQRERQLPSLFDAIASTEKSYGEAKLELEFLERKTSESKTKTTEESR
jgi:hypothetical protein